MVSALIDDRESQDNPQLNLGKLYVTVMSEFFSYIYMHNGFHSSISKCLIPHSKVLQQHQDAGIEDSLHIHTANSVVVF